MQIIQNKLTDDLKKIIYNGFEEHSVMKTGVYEIEEPISFYIESTEGKVISTVVCQTFWGALRIKYVWTHKNYRAKGYASKLMKEALNFAKDRKHSFAFVETMNFQAPDFYKKFGFETELIRAGYSKETSLYYMRKDFKKQVSNN